MKWSIGLILGLGLCLVFAASPSQGGWMLRIHQGATVEERALADVDSLTFYDATGSCCALDGTCTVTTQAACPDLWTLHGVCAPNPCSGPTGACCNLVTGACTITPQAACAFTWLGTAVACNTVTCPAAPPGVIRFTTQGAGFAPVIVVTGDPTILWSFDDGTSSSSATPNKDFGSAAPHTTSLSVEPWSAVQRINIGYDGGDGGSWAIEHVSDQQVSAVEGLENVASTLQQWCSSYNLITALDFGDFVNLDTIECFLSQTLTSVNLAHTPQLKRACFEDCNLQALDLSQSPLLEDLRGAVNAYPTIEFGTIGSQLWHICVRDNPQLTNRSLFTDLAAFPAISELFIWNCHQTGTLRLPASSTTRWVSLAADGNTYTALDLSGSLHSAAQGGSVSFQNNQLTSVTLTGCVQIHALDLENNQLGADQVDGVLVALDGLGRTQGNSPGLTLTVDLRGNAIPGVAGQAAGQSLADKGWTVQCTGWIPNPPPAGEPGRIDFTTRGNDTQMRCDFYGNPTAIWHWSDGTSTVAQTGQTATATGLGAGDHAAWLEISDRTRLTRFGAADGGGRGHLVSITGLDQAPSLNVLYAYAEADLATLSATNATVVREYHLAGTGLTTVRMDQLFADAVATNVLNGHLWAPNLGTPASASDRATLAGRGWTIEAWSRALPARTP